MCMGGGSAPALAKPLAQPQENSTEVRDSQDLERRRRAAAGGGSVLTSASGDLSAAPTVGKKLLGQ
jgi:hypothetical protein